MKRLIAFLFVLFGFSNPLLANDSVYQKEIIGTWVLGQQDLAYGTLWSHLEYHENGKTTYYQYASAKCEKLVATVHGTWVILNGTLVNTALSSTGQIKVPLGETFADKIVSLSDGEMVLQTDRGVTAYRTKNKSCSDH